MDTFAMQYLVWGPTLQITQNKSGLQVLCQSGVQSKSCFNHLAPTDNFVKVWHNTWWSRQWDRTPQNTWEDWLPCQELWSCSSVGCIWHLQGCCCMLPDKLCYVLVLILFSHLLMVSLVPISMNYLHQIFFTKLSRGYLRTILFHGLVNTLITSMAQPTL